VKNSDIRKNFIKKEEHVINVNEENLKYIQGEIKKYEYFYLNEKDKEPEFIVDCFNYVIISFSFNVVIFLNSRIF
jgi:hypothetical protein